MKKFRVTYREQGMMGWNKVKTMSVFAENEEDARTVFERWASKPSQYRRTFIKATGMES